MADGGHPGVRSLLARFENNTQSKNNTTSPPSRGRSPVGSEHSGSGRPLSKVRASFVAVDRSAQSPASTARIAGGGSDSPAPPARGRSFNSDELEGGLKSPVSFSPPSTDLGAGQKANVGPLSASPTPKTTSEAPAPPNGAAKENMKPNVDNSAPSPTEKTTTKHGAQPTHKTTTQAAPTQKAAPAKTVTKRPSNIHVTKSNASSQPASKSPAKTSPTKTGSDKAPQPTRSTKATAAATKDSSNPPARAPAHKPSRASLNPAAKPAPRPARPSAAATRDATKPARLPASATTPNLASAAKNQSLTRKPSTLKSATNGSHARAITPTVRKQPARSSPPTRERPHSRASNTGSSKPVDEGFLARMMRPTASSASKTHDKVEGKSPPPKAAKTARAPRKVLPKADLHGSRLTKQKEAPETDQAAKEPAAPEAEVAHPVEEVTEKLAETSIAAPVEPEETARPISEVEEPAPVEQPIQTVQPVEESKEVLVEQPVAITEEKPVEPEVTLVQPEETLIQPEETLIQPEETLIQPEEMLIQPEETLIQPEETLVEFEAKPVEPEEKLVEESADQVTDAVPVIPEEPVSSTAGQVVTETTELPASTPAEPTAETEKGTVEAPVEKAIDNTTTVPESDAKPTDDNIDHESWGFD